MANGVEELLDMLFEMVDEAKSAAFSSDKCVIERDRALDLIDDIRAQFPMEMNEAKRLIATRNEYIENAKRQAELVVQQAQDQAKRLVDEHEIVYQAKVKSNEMITEAEERSTELKRSANEYCEDALRRTEEAVAEAYKEIQASHNKFRAAAGGAAPVAPTPTIVRPGYDPRSNNQ